MKELRKGYYSHNENYTLSWEGECVDNVFNGFFKSYSPDGHVYWEGYYLKGLKEGEEVFYKHNWNNNL